MNYKKILVPLDGSECSDRALEKAAELGRLAGSEITLLYVLDMTVYAQTATGANLDSVYKVMSDEADSILKEASEKVSAAGLECRTVKAEGTPGRIISERSKDFDIVVMGTAGRTGIRKMIMGSVTQFVIVNTDCPVMAVRTKETKK